MFLMVSPGDAATPPSARLLPSTPEAAGAFALHSGSTTFWDLVQSPVPMLKGYAIVPDDRAGAANGTAFSSVEIWSVVFGSGARVLAAVQRDSSSIHTRVKVRALPGCSWWGLSPHAPRRPAMQVLGDRSMLVKYLNPNTVFVATGHGSEPETSGMVIHIIDTVTGRHLFRQLHKVSKCPRRPLAPILAACGISSTGWLAPCRELLDPSLQCFARTG